VESGVQYTPCGISPSALTFIVLAGGNFRAPLSTVRGAGTTVCSVTW